MMENINKMMSDLVTEHQSDASLAVGQLTMKIQGVVDAVRKLIYSNLRITCFFKAVNGGTTKYEEAFLTERYLQNNPNDHELVEKLKNLIANQVPILDVALSVHRLKVASDLMPLHERLEECFRKMQNHIESKYGKRTTDLKCDQDPTVILRKNILSMSNDNRLSETSMGSSEYVCF